MILGRAHILHGGRRVMEVSKTYSSCPIFSKAVISTASLIQNQDHIVHGPIVAGALTGDLQWMPLRWRMAMRSMTAARREGCEEALSLVQGPRRRDREALSVLECRSRLPDPWLTADAVVAGGCNEKKLLP